MAHLSFHLALLLSCLFTASSVQVNIPAYGEECFLEVVEAVRVGWRPAVPRTACGFSPAPLLTPPPSQSNKLTGSYEVLSGGVAPEIDVTIYGPQGEGHYSTSRQKSGHFTVIAPTAGAYRLCLSNRVSYPTPKLVAFTLHVGDALFRDVATADHITPLESEVVQLADGVARVEDEQAFLWAREAEAAEVGKKTASRLLWLSVGEAAALIVLGCVQVALLRGFFERKGRF